MKDLPDAIEKLSTLFYFRLDNITSKRGWAGRHTSQQIAVDSRSIQLIGMQLHLPLGGAANFMPRAQAESSGESWHIDIKRTDGVRRRSFVDGVRVSRSGKEYAILYGKTNDVLTDEKIGAMLDDIAKPGPTGIAQWIRNMYATRFDVLPVEVSMKLEAITDADTLDQIYAKLLNVGTSAEADSAILKAA